MELVFQLTFSTQFVMNIIKVIQTIKVLRTIIIQFGFSINFHHVCNGTFLQEKPFVLQIISLLSLFTTPIDGFWKCICKKAAFWRNDTFANFNVHPLNWKLFIPQNNSIELCEIFGVTSVSHIYTEPSVYNWLLHLI